MPAPKRKFDPKSWDHTFELISWWDAEKVRAAKVIVVGAGALGNEVLKNLALLNVGHVTIIDFDTIEYSNLSRSVLFREKDTSKLNYKALIAAARIQEINPNIEVKAIVGKIPQDVGLGVFREADVVIGCLDNRLARLFINRMCYKVNKTWVDGGIQNLAGQVTVYRPGESCYECSLNSNDRQFIQFQLGCPDIARRSFELGRVPTTPLAASIIAAMQVQEAIKVIHGNDDKLLIGERVYYEGMNNDFIRFKTRPMKDDCLSHFTYDPIIELKALHTDMPVEDALPLLQAYFGDEEVYIELDEELVTEITTKESEKTHQVLIAKGAIDDEVVGTYQEIPHEEIVITASIGEIQPDFPFPKIPLSQAGIPARHIIRVRAHGKLHFVEIG